MMMNQDQYIGGNLDLILARMRDGGQEPIYTARFYLTKFYRYVELYDEDKINFEELLHITGLDYVELLLLLYSRMEIEKKAIDVLDKNFEHISDIISIKDNKKNRVNSTEFDGTEGSDDINWRWR